ncbi:NAD(P)/FAD-dependent oxidoreductase [Polaromonas hydrogenivorans]|uniref:NAD(P)/FAD-dependent oxidoreductase n=1 Tax=Polaromonas hydrogenivorans TaxID=335476 RepID=A0AAU7LZT1_9BURK
MSKIEQVAPPTAETIFTSWVERFGRTLEAGDVPALLQHFDTESYWKDFLSFSWEHRTFVGHSQIQAAFNDALHRFEPHSIVVSPGRTAPRITRRSAKSVLEGFFDFQTKFGRGTAFVRLLHNPTDPMNPRIWMLLTSLQELHGFEEKIGARRPTGNQYAMNTTPNNWMDDRQRQQTFEDRDPEVLIVGAGHAGLILAARLGQLGVDTLVVDKTERIGDVWRERYHSLTLHNESTANHMPYIKFPETWPLWLSKDRLAGWLESYAEALELNVWTGTELVNASYDDIQKIWTATLRRSGKPDRIVRCPHLTIAIGVSGSIPNIPDIDGIQDFKGEVMHSGHYSHGKNYQGKRAIVIGTGNSGHDVAQDLHVNGAEKVWMYQRSPTCVVSLEPSATMVYKIYSEGLSVHDIDLVTSAIPYPVLEQTYQFMSKRCGEMDKPMLDSLNKVGFETYYGRDNTGFHMMYLRGEGGYYINVGCAELIANGDVGVIQGSDADRFVAEGLRMKDGSVIPCDVVVLATGFKNMQEGIRRLVGDDIADRVGPIWGFDKDYQMRNMWRRTAQDGFWVMGGALIDARLNSRYLAIEIKAALEGLLPARADMPVVKREEN